MDKKESLQELWIDMYTLIRGHGAELSNTGRGFANYV